MTTAAVAFFAWVPVAQAWSWPVQGPVLQKFDYNEAHPYAAGQHRGIDIGAAAAGESVDAPASGTVTFAGAVPTNGDCVTIETADGYSVTLTHLGTVGVVKGASVAEGAVVGTVGPSGTPDFAQPYVHLGIRVNADANGYVDPLGLLPALAPPQPSPGSSGSSGSSGSAGTGDSSSAASTPAPGSAPNPVAASQPHANAGGAGIVIRSSPVASRAARPTSKPATTQLSERGVRPPAALVAEPPRPRRALSDPAAAPPETSVTLAHATSQPASPAQPESATSKPTPTPTPRSASVLLPSALVIGPGVLASIAALLTAFRRKRRRSPRAVVVRYPLQGDSPPELEMRRAA